MSSYYQTSSATSGQTSWPTAGGKAGKDALTGSMSAAANMAAAANPWAGAAALSHEYNS